MPRKLQLKDLPKNWKQIMQKNSDEGASHAELAKLLGISRDTFYRMKREYPTFAEEVKLAEDRAEAWWIKMGRAATAGKIKNFNSTAWIFNMKNRFGWKDRQDVAVGDGEGGPAKVVHKVKGISPHDSEEDE